MDYRRRALLRSKQTAPTPPPANRLDRVVAISSIASNIVIGVGTLVLAAMGFNLTRDFNQWQVKNTERQVVSDNKELLEKAIDRCYSRAGAVFGMIKGLGENEAATILQKTDGSTTSCKMMGLEIPDLAALFIVKDSKNIDPKIVQRARNRVAVISVKPSVSRDQVLMAAARHNIERAEIKARLFDSAIERDKKLILDQMLLQSLQYSEPATEDEIRLREAELKPLVGRRRAQIVVFNLCNKKLDAEVKAKPNELSWSVKCDDGTVQSRSAF